MKGCRQRGHALFVYINIDARLEGLFRVCARARYTQVHARQTCLCVVNYRDDEVERRCRVGTCVLPVHLHQSALARSLLFAVSLPFPSLIRPTEAPSGPQSPSCHSAARLIENNQASDGTITLTL